MSGTYQHNGRNDTNQNMPNLGPDHAYINFHPGKALNDSDDYLDEPFPSASGQPITHGQTVPHIQPTPDAWLMPANNHIHNRNDQAHKTPPHSTMPTGQANSNNPSGSTIHQEAYGQTEAIHPGIAAHQASPTHAHSAHAAHQPMNQPMNQPGATNHANGNREFNPTPILVPVPNPVGRSKIRKEKQQRKRAVFLSLAAVAVLTVLVLVFFPWDRTITLNGEEYTVKAHTTIHEAADAKNINADPGDLLAIDGSIIEKGKGESYTFTVNGQTETNSDYELQQNDVVEVGHGADRVEEFTEEVITASAPVVFDGVGAVHAFTNEGSPGTTLRKIGQISGITVDTVQTEPSTETMRKYNINSGQDKVIALTFDDGPWKTHTSEILDILRDNNAKATFFTVGNRIAGLEDVVKRASDEGHQICTHTWDHASGSGQGVNLDYMTDDEQRQEISKGLEAISNVTGKEASKVVRVPGGNLSENTARILSEFATSEIGWNIDTNDWRRPGAESIFNNLLAVSPGDIILMHDGGGDRSQTVQALRDALPILAQQGYRFITIDELIQNYPVDGE